MQVTSQSHESQSQKSAHAEHSLQEKRFAVRHKFLFGRCLAYASDDYTITMVACDHRGQSRTIAAIERQLIPAACVHDEQRSHFLSTAITSFERRFSRPFLWRNAAVAGRETAFRAFQMPTMSDKELSSAIPFEAQKQVPFPLDGAVVDYRKVSSVKSGPVHRLQINLHAATERSIGNILNPFRTSRLPVRTVHHSHDVLGSLLTFVPGFDEDGNYALMYIGRGSAEIAFYRGDTLEFLHTSPVDSSLIPDDEDPVGLKYLASFLSSELLSSMDYYAGHLAQSATDRLFCYGELAGNLQLLEMMSHDINSSLAPFPVDMLPFLRDADNEMLNRALSSLAVVASAASNNQSVSLLTPSEKALAATKAADFRGKSLLSMVALLLIGLWGMQAYVQEQSESDLAMLQGEITRFQASESYQTYLRLKERIASNQMFFNQLRAEPGLLGLNLMALSQLTPSAVTLYNYEFNPVDPGKNLLLQGTVYSDNVPPEVILSEYVQSLMYSPFYKEVIVSRWTKRRLQDGFEIDFALNMRGVS